VPRRAVLLTVCGLLLPACGRFGFGGDDEADAAVTPDARVDALADARNDLGMFSTPVAMTVLDDPASQDDDPTLPDDMLEIFFDASRDGGAGTGSGDIWVATRPSTGDPFGGPALVAELASVEDDTSPDVSGDGLRMYFGSERETPNNREIFFSERADRTSPWSTPVRVPGLESAGDDSGAIEFDGGLALMFKTSRAGTNDLYMATRPTLASPWGAPIPVPGLADPTLNESEHWVSEDGLVVYFSSDQPGGDGYDIWRAQRPDLGAAFDQPERVTELSTATQDVDPWLSPDQRTIVFMSYRTGNGDLYMATR
jgi:hypothetical protein